MRFATKKVHLRVYRVFQIVTDSETGRTMDNNVPKINIDDFNISINAETMGRVSAILAGEEGDVSDIFFKCLLERPESAIFLGDDLVEQHLKPSLRRWIGALIAVRTQGDLDRFLNVQKEIGARHARIALPMQELQVGMSVIRRELSRRLAAGCTSCRELGEAIIAVDSLIDLSVSVLSQVYVADVVADARNSQALNLQATGIDMALQTEGLRASLFDWHRQILSLLMAKETDRDRFPAIRRTNFGLWVLHKGDLMFPGSPEIKLLEQIVRTIDERFDKIFGSRDHLDLPGYQRLIDDVENEVTAATAILSAMTDRTLAMEGGRDSLTKLFNRRFLRTVMQREIRLSQSSGDRFGVLLVDIDHFKMINDNCGHETGDKVLKQIAELLVGAVRAGDFVFRYGGEEFLLMVGGMTVDILIMIAEKVRLVVQQNDFRDSSGTALTVTVSIGLALHDGHPDYQRLIASADDALYEAKRGGRNRHVLFSQNAKDGLPAAAVAASRRQAPSDGTTGPVNL